MVVKIKDLPIEERPYEKLINNGVENLSNEELIAILIKSGTSNLSAKELASLILKNVNNINELKDISYKKLISIKGIGLKKSCVLLSAIELGKRINNYSENIINKKLNSSTLVFEYYKNKLKGLKQEHFYCVYLDNSKKIIHEKLLFIGTINYSVVHPREIFKEAYTYSASAIICIHNHPSNNILPSSEDIRLTNNIKDISNILGIKLVDHIIIGKDNYYSFLENGDI
jgi:DNA repair protein RadC